MKKNEVEVDLVVDNRPLNEQDRQEISEALQKLKRQKTLAKARKTAVRK